MGRCGLYLSFAVTIRKFCAYVTNGIEWPVESFEREIINEARCVALIRSERYKAAYHGSSHGFLKSRKTHVSKAQNLSTIYSRNWRSYASASRSRTDLVSWSLYSFSISGCLRVESLDLEQIATTFPVMIRGKRKLQDHICKF